MNILIFLMVTFSYVGFAAFLRLQIEKLSNEEKVNLTQGIHSIPRSSKIFFYLLGLFVLLKIGSDILYPVEIPFKLVFTLGILFSIASVVYLFVFYRKLTVFKVPFYFRNTLTLFLAYVYLLALYMLLFPINLK